jgi:hypothetical protein
MIRLCLCYVKVRHVSTLTFVRFTLTRPPHFAAPSAPCFTFRGEYPKQSFKTLEYKTGFEIRLQKFTLFRALACFFVDLLNNKARYIWACHGQYCTSRRVTLILLLAESRADSLQSTSEVTTDLAQILSSLVVSDNKIRSK